MFTEVNEGDARAAMKVWITTIGTERGIPVDPDPHFCRSVDEVIGLGKTLGVDAMGFTAPEFPELQRHFKFDRIAVSTFAGSITENYLLLVHQDSGLAGLKQLQGRSLNVLLGPRTSLATHWLDTVLLEARLGRVSTFFGKTSPHYKPSPVALQVFFRQADACLITRASFNLLGELNPQLAKKLRILAESPSLVPSGFGFCANGPSGQGSRVLSEMTRLLESPAGRQILALTQSESIRDCPLSVLDSSLELLARHKRLCTEAVAAASPSPRPKEDL